ncbi:hypothetical protein EYF88_12150 [Paracoccus sediminis]|uniref:Uncharacterized protein n=1 Tax=Paracoccus sediminis TaxID=1214787 RepID=A0A238X469_9RHOB|nr:hypothetical protein [Paracoccus sediminis]TBN49320.1 hypothetical protein EYF88_12150 [Paracoccus sediminis]SNR52649.1 hypothetical protein SAMN06265378_10765 [Paracoccus sediminis]
MSDLLLLGGVALCLLSVIAAVVQLLRTQPPRAAAILLVLGIAAIFAGVYLADQPFALDQIPQAWDRLVGASTTP